MHPFQGLFNSTPPPLPLLRLFAHVVFHGNKSLAVTGTQPAGDELCPFSSQSSSCACLHGFVTSATHLKHHTEVLRVLALSTLGCPTVSFVFSLFFEKKKVTNGVRRDLNSGRSPPQKQRHITAASMWKTEKSISDKAFCGSAPFIEVTSTGERNTIKRHTGTGKIETDTHDMSFCRGTGHLERMRR